MFVLVVAVSLLGLWLVGYSSAVYFSEDPPAKVYILAGQSNMVGVASSSNLPQHLAKPRGDVLIFESAKDNLLKARRWVVLTPGGVFGPEVSFGRRMADHHGQPVGVIKVAKGGTSLAKDWSPDRRGYLYDLLIETVREATKTGRFEIEAVVWMQGERDALDATTAGLYAQNFARFIRRIRSDLGQPDLPFVFGRVNPGTKWHQFVDQVRQAQQELDVPHTAMVDCDDLGKHRDRLHYDAAGQVELGQRFAEAVIQLQTAATPGNTGSE